MDFLNFLNRAKKSQTFDNLVAAAEKILSKELGSSIQLTQVERLSKKGRRNLLLRCHILSERGLPSSLIIKKVEADPYEPEEPNSWDTMRFFRDWMGSQFLTTIPSQFNHSPRFYGGDRQLGFIILEDVKHRSSLVEPMLGKERSLAEEVLLKYATCLGQLHADTMGKAAEFEELFRTISPVMKSARLNADINKLRSTLNNLDIHLETNCWQDLEAITDTVARPDAFLAYIHADPCPDNVLYTGEILRLIDFETGHFGHALIDATYARMMFPSCWCANRLPHKVVQQMENAYRSILSQHCSAAENDRVFEAALVNICGFWLLNTLMHLEYALGKDPDWGISTIRQRILARLEAFITTSEEFERLPGLHSTSSQLLVLLRERWSDISPMPFYPAFQGE